MFQIQPRRSDFGGVVAILLTLAVFVYAGVVLFDASRSAIGSVLQPLQPAKPTLTIADSIQAQATPVPARAEGARAAQGTSATPTATPAPTAKQVKVANTGGDGVYLRRTPKLDDRLIPWPDNTVMELVGDDVQADGTMWRKVKDPRGNVGFIPAQYLLAVQ